MVYLIFGLSLINTFLILVFFFKQKDINKRILNSLESHEDGKVEPEENKKHIDDMLKMREMYESD